MEDGYSQCIQFIGFDSDEKIFITEQAKSFLWDIKSKFIGVICATGKYRTGKSYLLNKVII